MGLSVKCLLVDDIEENLVALSALLREEDVEILTAQSGAEALELLLEHDVALALLDVQMPEMDGFQLAELMRGSERTRHVPLIFVTAGSRDQHRQFKGYDRGAVDFLYKPVEPHILKSKADIFFQLHRQKQQLAQDLEQRTETLRVNEMFMAVLGHDLRNPLNAILLSAHALQRTTDPELIRKAAGRIVSSGTRMSRMIEDVLDVVRARLAGGIPLQQERGDLGVVLTKVVQEHMAAHPGRSIEVRQEGDLQGEWDAGRIAQVASNLIGNALQYGEANTPVVVQANGTQTGTVIFTVANAGTIQQDSLPFIFEAFRGRTSRGGRNDGLGLGLYIVRQIVEAHHGRVDVQSGTANRTVFTVTLPRHASEK